MEENIRKKDKYDIQNELKKKFNSFENYKEWNSKGEFYIFHTTDKDMFGIACTKKKRNLDIHIENIRFLVKEYGNYDVTQVEKNGRNTFIYTNLPYRKYKGGFDDNGFFTDEAIYRLKKEIRLGSWYFNDYENSFGLDVDEVLNFFDGYMEWLLEIIEEDMEEDWFKEEYNVKPNSKSMDFFSKYERFDYEHITNYLASLEECPFTNPNGKEDKDI